MGAKPSREPRSVSMDNPTPASGVLDISDDVVKRLKQGITQQARESAAIAEESKPVAKPQQPAKKAPVKAAAESAPAAPKAVYQNPTPIYVQGGGHTISAADVQRQMNQELQKNDEQWRQRMTQLEENLKKTNTIMESEYANAVEGVHKRFVSTAAAQKTPPCKDLKAQLLACYRAHPGETLKCIEEVAQFKQCVDVHRIKKLDSEPETPKAPSSSKAAVPVPKAG